MQKSQHGVTLIELIVYMGIVSTILVVLYQLIAVGGESKINEIVNDELYINAERIMSDMQTTIKSANTIDTPSVSGESSATLVLNGGLTSYTLDQNNILQKTANGITAPLISGGVTVSDILFTRHGPSVASPTIVIQYVITGNRAATGGVRSRTYQTAVTVR